MNGIMKRKTRVAGLFLIGFALSLAGTGETTVILDAPAGIAAGIVLGGLGPAPLAAQAPDPDCKACQDQWFVETEDQPGGWGHRFPDVGIGAMLDCSKSPYSLHPIGCEDQDWHGFYPDTAEARHCAHFHPACDGGGGHLALVEAGITDFQDAQAVEDYLSRNREYVRVADTMNHIFVNDCAGLPSALITIPDHVAESLRSSPFSQGDPGWGTGKEAGVSEHQASRGHLAHSLTR